MGYSARDAAEEIARLFAEIVPEAINDNVVAFDRKNAVKANS